MDLSSSLKSYTWEELFYVCMIELKLLQMWIATVTRYKFRMSKFFGERKTGSDNYDMDLGSVAHVSDTSSRSSFQEDQSKIPGNFIVSEGTPSQMDIDVEM